MTASQNYNPTGNVQTTAGALFYKRDWQNASVNDTAFWATQLADQQTFQNFLLNFQLYGAKAASTQQVVTILAAVTTPITQADCDAVGANFQLFNGLINWTASLALMKTQAKTYQN